MNNIIQGDCLEVLKTYPDNHFTSIITDPPYFLLNDSGSGFMNKSWDGIISLWKYQWSDNQFVDFVISLLKCCKVEKSMEEGFIVQENVNITLKEKITENLVNSAEKNLNTQTKNKGSVQLIVLTKQDLLDLLPERFYIHTKLFQYLNGEKENVAYAIPVLLPQNEHRNIVQKAVTTLRKANVFQERKISFTRTEIQRIKEHTEVMTGISQEKQSINEISGNVGIAEYIVIKRKSNAIILSHIEKEEITTNLTLLLCAYLATRTSSDIQKNLIKSFFKVIFQECLRVLKPGGTVLAFGGSRTHHDLMTSIEDAGFLIKDCLMYLYGSGFPKSLNVGKAVDKVQGNEREVIGKKNNISLGKGLGSNFRDDNWKPPNDINDDRLKLTKGKSDFEGYGTALKPAVEIIVMAIKKNDGTYANNAIKHGVAGINIDKSRIEGKEKLVRPNIKREYNEILGKGLGAGVQEEPQGRFPSNLILDEEAGQMLGDKARFFYTAKASKAERAGSTHPTMKPLKLMKYLINLIMPPKDGLILDPFAGSGTTILAAKQLGYNAIGIERELDYCEIARKRIGYVDKDEIERTNS